MIDGLPGHPKIAFDRAAAHWRSCGVCMMAGGVRAPRDVMCAVGQSLHDAWEEAEIAWPKARAAYEARMAAASAAAEMGEGTGRAG